MPQKKKESYLYSLSASKFVDKDGGYNLSEPSNFYEYLELICTNEATERQHDEFYLRMIFHFCKKVYSNEQPEQFVMNALANALYKVTQGGRWEDEIKLPWTQITMPFSPAESKAIELFCLIENAKRAEPSKKITKIIEDVANKNAVSFETAKAAYYQKKLSIYRKK